MSNTKKIVRILLIINALQLLAGIVAWSYIANISREEKDYFTFLVLGMLLLSSLIILTGLYVAWKSNDNQYEETLRDLEALNRTLRAQRHDYLNHFQVMHGLMELGEYEEARKYLAPVFRELNQVGRILKTASPAVNALLQAKLQAAESADIEVGLDIKADLSKLPMEAWSLCRVLSNIIDNAIRALTERKEEGGASQKTPCLKILISEGENNYYFTISNNGPQIPETLKKNLFLPGVTTKKEEGHGMGLYITDKIIREAGGKLQFTSTEESTVFHIMIPKAQMEQG